MKEKGFTLVELLAVIVILAIIAVIAVPIVLNVISKSKKGAAIDSAYSYVDAIEKYIVMHDMDETKYPKNLESGETYQVSNTTYTETSSINLIEKVYAEDSITLNDIISIKGTKPSKGIVTISEKRKVGKAILIINSYKVICETGKCNIDGELVSTEESTPSTEPVETCEYEVGKTWNYEFDPDGDGQGQEQTFEVPCDGTYKIELWGASGGDSYLKDVYSVEDNYGTAGYTSGNIHLKKNEKLYLYVGEKGKSSINTSFNGGGGGGYGCSIINSRGQVCYNNPINAYNTTELFGNSGGGATDVRIVNGNWNDDASMNSRIMVSAGGGGKSAYYDAGLGDYGGGLTGYNGTYYAGHGNRGCYGYGATQISGGQSGANLSSVNAGTAAAGSFGIGGSSNTYSSALGAAGGGGGYYGGGAGGGTTGGGVGHAGGGGSSYISGHTGCVAITSSTDRTPKNGCDTGTDDNSCSVHYSEKVFTDTIMIDGSGYLWTNVKEKQQQMPNPSGGYYELGTGHVGNGYARLTLVGN